MEFENGCIWNIISCISMILLTSSTLLGKKKNSYYILVLYTRTIYSYYILVLYTVYTLIWTSGPTDGSVITQ